MATPWTMALEPEPLCQDPVDPAAYKSERIFRLFIDPPTHRPLNHGGTDYIAPGPYYTSSQGQLDFASSRKQQA